MGVFEYIGVLVSVIMGLGNTHLATGTSKSVQHRDSVRFYLPHTVWTINILIYILMIWWGMFWWSQHEDWFAYEYLFITLYAIVLFFLASMLYPWDMREDVDLEASFFRNRRWFFGTLILAWLIDIPETILKASSNLREVPADYFVFVSFELTAGLIGFIFKNRVVHLLLPFVWLTFTLFYVLSSVVGRIDA